jgi:hypothetical protein
MKWGSRIAALILALVAGGCDSAEQTASSPAASPTTLPAIDPPPVAHAGPPEATTQPVYSLVDLHMYRITVPWEKISTSSEFWSRIDETAIDPTAHALLLKNGIRIGCGWSSDWPDFKKLFDRDQADTYHVEFVSPAAVNQEIPVSDMIPDQTIFYFDSHGLSGAVYQRCRDSWALTYSPTPGQTDSVRIELCPTVSCVDRHYRFTVLNNRETFEYTADKKIFDLSLAADVTNGRFLVIAPSTEAARAVSVGHQFLTKDANAGRREVIYVFTANVTTQSPK